MDVFIQMGNQGSEQVAPKFSTNLTIFQPGETDSAQYCRGQTKIFPISAPSSFTTEVTLTTSIYSRRPKGGAKGNNNQCLGTGSLFEKERLFPMIRENL